MQRLRRLAALAAILLAALAPPLFASDVVDLSAVSVTIDNVFRDGPECIEFENLACSPAPVNCKVVHHKRCTPGGMFLNVRVAVDAHPGALRIEAWDVHPGCLVPAGPCTKGSRGGFDWTVPAAEVGAPAVKEVRLEVPLDDPTSRVELVVGSMGRLLLPMGASDCRDVAKLLPSAAAIRARLQELAGDARTPPLGASWIATASAAADSTLLEKMGAGLAAARCYSGGAPGPVQPATVPADQVKAWMLALIDEPTASSVLRAFRPLVADAPAGALRWGWLQAVALKRGLARVTP